MKINKDKAIREDWDEVKSWNYKLTHLSPKMSVVYAEINKIHGLVHTNDLERIYYIIEGQGEFIFGKEIVSVKKGDVLTIPPRTEYDYKAEGNIKMKILLFMELWDN